MAAAGFLADRLEVGRVVQTEAACDAVCRPAGGRREQQEPDAAVNRKDAAMVVEADERVDIAARQQESAQRRAAMVGREPGGQHETDAAARTRERDRAFARSSW